MSSCMFMPQPSTWSSKSSQAACNPAPSLSESNLPSEGGSGSPQAVPWFCIDYLFFMFWFSNFSQGGSEARSREAQVIIVNVTKPGITWEKGPLGGGLFLC